MVKYIFLFFIFQIQVSYSQIDYSYWPNKDRTKEFLVEDTVSKEKNNIKIIAVYNKKKLLGFVRKIDTTTGCNSACLPIQYVAYYDSGGNYIKLQGDNLTKINHTPMSQEDLTQLDLFILNPPAELVSVKNPLELTDALTGATFKKFQPFVIKGGAYSTLRILTYHVETQKHLKKILENINEKN